MRGLKKKREEEEPGAGLLVLPRIKFSHYDTHANHCCYYFQSHNHHQNLHQNEYFQNLRQTPKPSLQGCPCSDDAFAPYNHFHEPYLQGLIYPSFFFPPGNLIFFFPFKKLRYKGSKKERQELTRKERWINEDMKKIYIINEIEDITNFE